MTSIKWLEEKMKTSLGDEFQYLLGFFTLAKEMHKEEIILFAEEYDEYVFRGGSATMEEYYQETFKKD